MPNLQPGTPVHFEMPGTSDRYNGIIKEYIEHTNEYVVMFEKRPIVVAEAKVDRA